MDILDYALEETMKYVKKLKIQEYFSTLYHQHLHSAVYAREHDNYEEEYLAYAKDCLAYNLMPRPVDDIFTEQYFRKRALFQRVYKKAQNEKEQLTSELDIFQNLLNHVSKGNTELRSLLKKQMKELERKEKTHETIVRWLKERHEQFGLLMRRASFQLQDQIERFYLQKIYKGLRKLFGKTQVKLYIEYFTPPSFKYSLCFSIKKMEEYLREYNKNIRRDFNFYMYIGQGYFNMNLSSKKFRKSSFFSPPTLLEKRFNQTQKNVTKLRALNFVEQELKNVREEKKKKILTYLERERNGLSEEKENEQLEQLEALWMSETREKEETNEDIFQEIKGLFGDKLTWEYERVPVLQRAGEFNIYLYSISSASGNFTLQLKEKPKEKSKKLSPFWKRKG